jgi:hypothetical protein
MRNEMEYRVNMMELRWSEKRRGIIPCSPIPLTLDVPGNGNCAYYVASLYMAIQQKGLLSQGLIRCCLLMIVSLIKSRYIVSIPGREDDFDQLKDLCATFQFNYEGADFATENLDLVLYERLGTNLVPADEPQLYLLRFGGFFLSP